ncbi:PDC sensor domain-containing protein, partial [Campylobacter sp. 2457A]|uniref:PDC sensor domain-containing protein n=1 Tax=Campylobacter sp. 2457A TaxID=2735784 RepID=UPI00301E0D47|nr:methyl-accepting chemotaxis protein [Campylobacter sp. 2457A]
MLESFKEAFGFKLVFLGFENSGRVLLSDRKILDSKSFNLQNAGWYQSAHGATKTVVYGPYKSATDGVSALTYTMPIYKNGKFIGAVGGDY